MNQGRIWCVVKPTVGLPLFIGGVLVVSLLVHASILSNSTWFSKFLVGSSSGSMAQVTAPVDPTALASQ